MPIRFIVDISVETLQTRREWNDILKDLGGEKSTNQEYYTQKKKILQE
jgi:hypothetical protein